MKRPLSDQLEIIALAVYAIRKEINNRNDNYKHRFEIDNLDSAVDALDVVSEELRLDGL